MNPTQELVNMEILAFGQTTVSKFRKLKILLYGLKGIGVEIAKNILLLGPAHLALKDDLLVKPTDLTSNLFLKESHVGKETRARACFPILNKINPQVQLTIQEGDLTEDYVKNFDLIIFTKYYPLKDLISLNKFCRNQKKPIGFVLCQAFGLHAYCFIDYGEGFKIYDKDGEEPKPFLIGEITKASPGVVTLIKEKPHNFSDGDFVRIYEVEGMTEVNGTDTRPIRILSPYSFTIEDTKEFSQYVRGGFVEIAKVPFRINFRSLEERMLRPFDEKKEVSPPKKMLHLGYLSLMEYGTKYGTFPELNNKQQAQIMVDMAHEIVEKHRKMIENGRKDVVAFDKVDDDYIRNLALFAKCQVTPFCAFWAGIISLELVKFTGKFIPLQDFYHFDSFECLPHPEGIIREPNGNRYDDQVIIFGKDTQEYLQRMNVLIVGSGASGCEFLKNLALMGVATLPNHSIKLVDEAIIKPTNVNSHHWLSSEFLKEYKCKAASNWVKRINDQVNLEPITLNLSEKNEKIFNEEFWRRLDVIICATDDEETRKTLRHKAIWYEKVLLDTKISGTKAHSQVVLPFKTTPWLDEYLSKKMRLDLNFETLEFFPYLPEHTVFWAKETFNEVFGEIGKECRNLLLNPGKFIQDFSQNKAFFKHYELKLNLLYKIFEDHKKMLIFDDLVVIAKDIFEFLYFDKIQALIKKYPIDGSSGNANNFWTGYRKIPKPEEFDLTEESHMNFVIQTANILAVILNIQPNFKKPNIISIVKNSIQNKVRKLDFLDQIEKLEGLMQSLGNSKICQDYKFKVFNLEDDELERNLCLEFITVTSNLKSRCYNLLELQRYKVEKIAFNIERNIGITHQMIAGILCMELFKIAENKEKLHFRNANIDLRFNQYEFMEPSSPKNLTGESWGEKYKNIPENFDPWKKIEISNSITLDDLIAFVKESFNVIALMIFIENMKVYDKSGEVPQIMLQKNLNTGMKIEDIQKAFETSKKTALEININGLDSEGNLCKLAKIKYILAK